MMRDNGFRGEIKVNFKKNNRSKASLEAKLLFDRLEKVLTEKD
jgi:hypothetical protein